MPLCHPLPFPPSHPPQVLLTGATTYIGGTVLSKMLDHPIYPLKHATITCVVHSSECASTLLRVHGEDVNLFVHDDIEDIETAALIASKHDIVINCAPSSHAWYAIALMEGLSQRKRRVGRDVWFLHTSDTKILTDLPVSKKRDHEGGAREFDDAKDDIYDFEKVSAGTNNEHLERTVVLEMIEKRIEINVKTLVMVNPMVYGQGSGLFERNDVQISAWARVTLATGEIIVVGDGNGVCDHVHVEDLAELYKIMVVGIMKDGGKRLPYGKTGMIFSANGRHNWNAVAWEVADTCRSEGFVSQRKLKHVGLEEGANLFSAYLPQVAKERDVVELRLCSNLKTRTSIARTLGWKPRWRGKAWKRALRNDVRIYLRPEHKSSMLSGSNPVTFGASVVV